MPQLQHSNSLMSALVKLGLGCVAFVVSFPIAAYGHLVSEKDDNPEINSYSDRVTHVFCGLVSIIGR